MLFVEVEEILANMPTYSKIGNNSWIVRFVEMVNNHEVDIDNLTASEVYVIARDAKCHNTLTWLLHTFPNIPWIPSYTPNSPTTVGTALSDRGGLDTTKLLPYELEGGAI